MATTPTLEVSDIKGINQFADAIRASTPTTKAHYLAECVNSDIDSTGMVKRRNGYTVLYQGTAPHSLYGDEHLCLFVDGKQLKTLSNDYSVATTIASLNSNATMRYVRVVDKIYCTNGVDIGYVHADHHNYTALPTASKQYKRAMPAGQLIEYYNGRLYVARGSKLYISDPLYHGAMDIRKGWLRFKGYITLVQAVDDGMYVADGVTSFVDGPTPDKFERKQVASYNAVIGTSCLIDPNFVGGWVDKLFGATPKIGSMAMWLSEKGICIGLNKGQFANVTQSKYTVGDVLYGAALFKVTTGLPQYIVAGAK